MKKLVRYLKEIIYINFVFDRKSNNYLLKDLPYYNLISYVNNNFVEDLKD